MVSSPFLASLILSTLLVLSSAGTVQMSDGSSVTVADPTYKSLSSSYSLSDGFTWQRLRSGSYNKFPERYKLSVQPNCKI